MNIKMEKGENERHLFIFLQGSIIKSYYYNLDKKIIFVIVFFFKFYLINKYKKIKNLIPYKYYIENCKNHIRYSREKQFNKYPYISVCLPVLNMEKYIEQSLLSIINQSFQDFDIVIVNDNSNDNTERILKNMKLEDNRIKIINHSINKGVYFSRVEAILNAKGKYIILMDPDDLFLNENLFKKLYDYNLKYNIDIIEFKVYHQIEGRKSLIIPNNHFENHYHKFSKTIIYQPELSEILYQIPNHKIYSKTICRNIWNKLIRRTIFLDMYRFIGVYYFNQFVITADDMLMNLISYNFANNYSNIG